MPGDDQPAEPQVDNPTHVEDVLAPIIYADFCMGGGPMNGDNITLTFITKILDHRFNPPHSADKTVLRLVMPKGAVRSLSDFMTKLLEDIEGGQQTPPANTKLN